MATYNKTEAIGIFASIAVVAIAAILLRVNTFSDTTVSAVDAPQAAVVVASQSGDQNAAFGTALEEAADNTGRIQKLIIDDVQAGTGALVKEGDEVSVHYIGRLENGQEFDNSYTRGEPITFTVGAGRVIEGWDAGVVGMQTGGQRVLVIPSDLAYGDDGFGPIPGKATLIFALELVSIN